jgi:hypothetical protein
MHLIIKAHLNEFADRYELKSDQESKNFEIFSNYLIFKSFSAENIDAEKLVYYGADPGIDGIFIFADDRHISSDDEINQIFRDKKKDVEINIVFTQVKTSESWSKQQINTFQSAINDFLSEKSHYPQDTYIKEKKKIFDKVIKNIGKIANGKPNCVLYYVTTADQPSAKEIVAAFNALKSSVEMHELFDSVMVSVVGRSKLIELWKEIDGPIEGNIETLSLVPFPDSLGVEEAYIGLVSAKEFVAKILLGENGRIRQRIFDENVRDFMGESVDVNAEIKKTLTNTAKIGRFGILNNGVTIISNDIKVQGKNMSLKNFQIVNGCQTSHMVFKNSHYLSDSTNIMIKVIETTDKDVIDDIVRSTNRQTQVKNVQFLATLESLKNIEYYFEARRKSEQFGLYFERRTNQYYEDTTMKETRKFDITKISRCVGSMFFDRPDLACKYPSRLIDENKDAIFDQKNIEEIYYTAAYCLYRLEIFLGNTNGYGNYWKARWHILLAAKYFVCGENKIDVKNQKIKEYCAELIEFFGQDAETKQRMEAICSCIGEIGKITMARLKLSMLVDEIKRAALKRHDEYYSTKDGTKINDIGEKYASKSNLISKLKSETIPKSRSKRKSK